MTQQLYIFQDLRDEKPLPFQMLVDHRKASVTEIDEEESAVIVHQDLPWDRSQPVHTASGTYTIIEAEERFGLITSPISSQV